QCGPRAAHDTGVQRAKLRRLTICRREVSYSLILVRSIGAHMQKLTADRVRLDVVEAHDLSQRALQGIGYSREEARIIADHVLDAALCGYEYSGLAKILDAAEHGKAKKPRTPIRALHETDVSILFDGGNNVGML